jgi:hypothetical protein
MADRLDLSPGCGFELPIEAQQSLQLLPRNTLFVSKAGMRRIALGAVRAFKQNIFGTTMIESSLFPYKMTGQNVIVQGIYFDLESEIYLVTEKAGDGS